MLFSIGDFFGNILITGGLAAELVLSDLMKYLSMLGLLVMVLGVYAALCMQPSRFHNFLISLGPLGLVLLCVLFMEVVHQFFRQVLSMEPSAFYFSVELILFVMATIGAPLFYGRLNEKDGL